MTNLGVGLIGCGRIAQSVHLPILAALPGVQVVALAEPDPQRREEAGRRVPGAQTFASYQELLAVPEVEAAVVCLPNALHALAAIAALDGGRAVYLEKPLATSLLEAQDVLAAWQRSGQVAMIGLNYRFSALALAAREHIATGRLGELAGARSVFSSSARTLPDWKQARQSGGGVLLDLASHPVDLVHYLLGGQIQEVFAQLRSLRSEGDTAMVQMRLADGLLVQSFFSFSAVDEDRFELYGRAGKLAVDRYRSLHLEISEPTVDVGRVGWWGHALRSLFRSPDLATKARMPSAEPSYRAALEHFVAAAGDTTAEAGGHGGPPLRNRAAPGVSPDLWDGYRSLAVVAAAEESVRTGQPVAVDDPLYRGEVP